MFAEINVDSIIDLIWGIVEIGVVIGIGLWILSLFLPVDEFFRWIVGSPSKKKVVVRCKKCRHDNNKSAKFCSNCGEEL